MVFIFICECKIDVMVEDFSFSYESFGLGLFFDEDVLYYVSYLLGGFLKWFWFVMNICFFIVFYVVSY